MTLLIEKNEKTHTQKGEINMKRIIIACGSGVATFSNQKVLAQGGGLGYSGNYQFVQCQVSELAEKGKSADFAIATTVVGANMPCPVLPGLPLLTGVGADKLFSDVEEQMNKLDKLSEKVR